MQSLPCARTKGVTERALVVVAPSDFLSEKEKNSDWKKSPDRGLAGFTSSDILPLIEEEKGIPGADIRIHETRLLERARAK